TQWPAANGGASHSATNVPGPSSMPSSAASTRARRPRSSPAASRPPPGTPRSGPPRPMPSRTRPPGPRPRPPTPAPPAPPAPPGRADAAQRLGDHQVGPQPGELGLVDAVELVAALERAAHLGVDLGRGERLAVDPGQRDRGQVLDAGGVVALVAPADQGVP